MEYQNLSKKFPINIGIFVEEANDKILSDKAFLEINEILSKKENLINYTYTIFTDNNILRNNIYLPVMHTLYIGSKNSNIIISKDEDVWLKDHFHNNTYYCYEENFTPNIEKAGIKKISSIKEII